MLAHRDPIEHPIAIAHSLPSMSRSAPLGLDDVMAERRHAFNKTPPLQAMPHPNPRKKGFFLFPACYHNIHNVQDISASGVIPIVRKENGELAALLPEEDMNVAGDYTSRKIWAPALGLFGGKVDQTDSHWLATAARELNEETAGLLSPLAIAHVADFDPRSEGWPDEGNSLFCAYLPECKYQVVYYPVPDAFRQEWISLPQRYEEAFRGAPSADLQRSATKLHWVTINRATAEGGYESLAVHPGAASSSSPWESLWAMGRQQQATVGLGFENAKKYPIALSEVLHQCVNDDKEACAKRCDQAVCNSIGKALPSKRELKAALARSIDVINILAATNPRATSPAFEGKIASVLS